MMELWNVAAELRVTACLTAWIPVCGTGRKKRRSVPPDAKNPPGDGLMQTEGDIQRWKFKEARKCLRVYVQTNPIVEPLVNLEMLSKCHTGEKVWFGKLSNK